MAPAAAALPDLPAHLNAEHAAFAAAVATQEPPIFFRRASRDAASRSRFLCTGTCGSFGADNAGQQEEGRRRGGARGGGTGNCRP